MDDALAVVLDALVRIREDLEGLCNQFEMFLIDGELLITLWGVDKIFIGLSDLMLRGEAGESEGNVREGGKERGEGRKTWGRREGWREGAHRFTPRIL
jgi:hypothetical protein